MDNQTKVIMGLLVLVLILACIFVLKFSGIIKPAEKNTEEQELQQQLEQTLDQTLKQTEEQIEIEDSLSNKMIEVDGVQYSVDEYFSKR